MTVRDMHDPGAQMDVVSSDDGPRRVHSAGAGDAALAPRSANADDGQHPLAKGCQRYRTRAFSIRPRARRCSCGVKRLNVLLRGPLNRNHIAIASSTSTAASGLVTIEDVLEQIVGGFEDEYDFDENEDNIIAEANGRHRVKAQTEIGDFNAHFGTDFADDEFDTVGGLVLQAFGRLPKRGETVTIGDFRFRVVRADSRRLYTLQVEPKTTALPPAAAAPATPAPPAVR
jgi:Mg2+/Co2+ transporter CorC